MTPRSSRKVQDSGSDGHGATPRSTASRVAIAGLAAALLLLTGFSVWVAYSTSETSRRVSRSVRLADEYQAARFAVSTEESLERKYRLEPGPTIRADFEKASHSLAAALRAASTDGDARDRAFVARVLGQHRVYLEAQNRMFAAVDLGRESQVLRIDSAEVDPVFGAIEQQVNAISAQHSRQAGESLRSLGRSGTFVLIATPIAFALGLGLLGFFSAILIGYRRRIEQIRRSDSQRETAEGLSLLAETVNAVEEERIRLATEIHDGPLQHLAALGYKLELLARRMEKGDSSASTTTLAQAQEGLERDVHELRNIMSSLRPPALDSQGLEAALRTHVSLLVKSDDLQLTVASSLEGRVEGTLETVLFRIAQEALSNVVKHSRAHRASVAVSQEGDSVLLQIDDDGVGFSPEHAAGLALEGHFGLVGMRERVRMAGGSLTLESSAHGGTHVRAVIPRMDAAA
jgi:signal transduction histidine kinase